MAWGRWRCATEWGGGVCAVLCWFVCVLGCPGPMAAVRLGVAVCGAALHVSATPFSWQLVLTLPANLECLGRSPSARSWRAAAVAPLAHTSGPEACIILELECDSSCLGSLQRCWSGVAAVVLGSGTS
jgi:hypothetical protein